MPSPQRPSPLALRRVRNDGKGAVLNCHAGCNTPDVVAAIGLKMRDLFDSRPVAHYDYVDEHGVVLYQKVRYEPKTFRQRRPQGKGWVANLGKVRRVLYRLPEVAEAEAVYVCEGEKDADAVAATGAVATTWTEGAWREGTKPKWRTEYTDALAGKAVTIIRDRDEAGHHTAHTIAELIAPVAAAVTIVEPAEGMDAADHLAAGHTLDALVRVGAEPVAKVHDPMSLEAAESVFSRWFGTDYDMDAARATLAAAAVERLDGEPVWLLLISGPGNAKTETVMALREVATVTSTISSPGALLSATGRRERAKDATGGLLRELGRRGVLVIKDVTSILSMSRDARKEVLAALREVYDGNWTRKVGTDGGRSLEWTGRLAVIGAVTTAWDGAYEVISSMGDRFVLLRVDSTQGRRTAGRQAIGNTGHEVEMRAELAEAAGGVLAGMTAPRDLTEAEGETLLEVADLTTTARTAVTRDYKGEVIDAEAPEMPTRFAKQLAQMVRGALAIGLDDADAMALAVRCARDSVPPLRLAILEDVDAHKWSTVQETADRLNKPWTTVDREMKALHMLDLLSYQAEPYRNKRDEAVHRRVYSIAETEQTAGLQLITRIGGTGKKQKNNNKRDAASNKQSCANIPPILVTDCGSHPDHDSLIGW